MNALSNRNFYIIVAIVVLLIITGFIINIIRTYTKFSDLEKNAVFPPWPSTCPDYWESDGKGGCTNVKKIGICSKNGDPINFGDRIFTGSKGHYYKCNWAKECDAPWEGIDNLC